MTKCGKRPLKHFNLPFRASAFLCIAHNYFPFLFTKFPRQTFLGVLQLFSPNIQHFCLTHLFFLCGLFSAAKPVSGKRDYPQTIHTLAFIQDMHEKGFAAQ